MQYNRQNKLDLECFLSTPQIWLSYVLGGMFSIENAYMRVKYDGPAKQSAFVQVGIFALSGLVGYLTNPAAHATASLTTVAISLPFISMFAVGLIMLFWSGATLFSGMMETKPKFHHFMRFQTWMLIATLPMALATSVISAHSLKFGMYFNIGFLVYGLMHLTLGFNRVFKPNLFLNVAWWSTHVIPVFALIIGAGIFFGAAKSGLDVAKAVPGLEKAGSLMDIMANTSKFSTEVDPNKAGIYMDQISKIEMASTEELGGLNCEKYSRSIRHMVDKLPDPESKKDFVATLAYLNSMTKVIPASPGREPSSNNDCKERLVSSLGE